MRRVIVVMLSSLLLACVSSADDADTMSVGVIDTVKPATDSTAPAPVTGATTAATSQSTTKAATQSKTGTKTAPVDTTNIGRDRAIPINTKDPKVRLPTVDTTKRPPGGE